MPTLGIENNVLGILSRGLVQLGVFFLFGGNNGLFRGAYCREITHISDI